MPAIPRPVAGRFSPEALLCPRSVLLLGADTPAGALVLANLRQGGFAGPIVADAPPPEPADLAILCHDAPDTEAIFARLAAAGTHAAIVTGRAAGLRALAHRTGVRSLGPGSFGVAVPAIGLNATTAHLRPRAGRLALVSQSAALSRAVLDWAEPNGVGFSHIVGIGGNDDIGFALILDHLARDPGTGAILLDIRRVKDARAFLSAARAAARLRPVVAIRAGTRLLDPQGDADATLVAALRRAGVLTVTTLEDLLAAAETLTRARPPRAVPANHGFPLAIVTNAVGPAMLAADAALRDGLALARLSPETREVVRLAVPRAFVAPGGADVPEGVGDIVYAGFDGVKLAEAAALLAGAREVGGVLAVHAPTGPGDAAAIAALAASGALAVPLLACAMGETTGAGHRRVLAEAGIPVFATPEHAVRGFLHMVQHRLVRAAAARLPARTVLEVAPDRAAAARIAAAGPGLLPPEAARALLAAYGLRTGRAGGIGLRIQVALDAMFGPVIAIGQGGPAWTRLHDVAVDLPPLDLALATAMLDRTRIAAADAAAGADRAALADALVRVSQMIVDLPRIAGLVLDPLGVEAGAVSWAGAAITLLPPGAAAPKLALPPYPAELVEHVVLGGEALTIRPIRPEDAEAHAALFARLPAEDIRFRFFSAVRALSAEQIARLTQIDYDREMAFIAVRDATAETIAVARLVRETLGDDGEFAVLVERGAKGRGLAALLMRRLIDWGRAHGMRAVVGQILADNAPMLGFIRRLGFTLRRLPAEPDVMEARLEL